MTLLRNCKSFRKSGKKNVKVLMTKDEDHGVDRGQK